MDYTYRERYGEATYRFKGPLARTREISSGHADRGARRFGQWDPLVRYGEFAVYTNLPGPRSRLAVPPRRSAC